MRQKDPSRMAETASDVGEEAGNLGREDWTRYQTLAWYLQERCSHSTSSVT